MNDQPELDDAIDVAIDRTRGAQADVREALRPDSVAEPAVMDRVVHRAEDLHALADEAVAEQAIDQKPQPPSAD
ncbi:MAG: hypothetical protein QOF49_95 [Chloroflexota bacterium]|jgi:SOS response regulatory protein OraA/RecX|nr:hypothetical protein [Chloroflexota bacterium]